MLLRAILSDWAVAENPNRPKVREGDFSEEEIVELIDQFYNLYWLPNRPSVYDTTKTVDGTHIDVFEYVFVDLDMKHGAYATKDLFLDKLLMGACEPSLITDSGNGIHGYWRVSDLTAASFLRLQRRLCRKFNTDEAVSKLFQLMRLPESVNFKTKGEPKACVKLHEAATVFTCEQLDKWLPPITKADEEYCKSHYDRTYNPPDVSAIDTKLPLKFQRFLGQNKEAKRLFSGDVDDRSEADFELGRMLRDEGFTKQEGLSVLSNCRKAITRAPIHRFKYALDIADKIWGTAVEASSDEGELDFLSDEEQLRDFSSEDMDRWESTRNSLPFIDSFMNPYFRLSTGTTVIGAKTGGGKSTCCYNMIANIVKDPKFHKKVLMISNEATRWEVLSNIACLLLGISWKQDFNVDDRKPSVEESVRAKVTWLLKRITVVATSDGKGNCSDLSYIRKVMSHAKKYKESYALVVLDYLQTVDRDSENPKIAQYQISKNVGTLMRTHSQVCQVPTIVFAQLAELSEGRKEFKQRVEGDRTFLNHCHNALEIVPDYESSTTAIKARKLRYGQAPTWSVELKFRDGLLFSDAVKITTLPRPVDKEAS